MGLPFKKNNSKRRNPTCLEYEAFICYFNPHDNGHNLALVDAFHPRRLPPSGLQTALEYYVMTHFGLHEHLKVKTINYLQIKVLLQVVE